MSWPLRSRNPSWLGGLGWAAALGTLVLVATSVPRGMPEPVLTATFTDTCGAFTGTSPAFNESTVTRVALLGGTPNAPTLHVITNDESGLLLGEADKQTSPTYPVTQLGTPTAPFYKDVANPSLGDPFLYDGTVRPQFPALFITDITSGSSNAGDWQQTSGTRQVTDGVTASGSPVFKSSTAAFTSADAGKVITDTAGKNAIPVGTTIALVVNSTTVNMSANATSSQTGDLTTFGRPVYTSGASNLVGGTPEANFVGGSWSNAYLSSTGTYTAVKPVSKNNWDFGPGASGAPTPPWRQIADGTVTSGSNILTSTNAEFASTDAGRPIDDATATGGKGFIPAGTTIALVNSATNVTLSKKATGSASGDLVELGKLSVPFSAVLGSTGNEGFGSDVGWNITNLDAWNPTDKAYDSPLVAGHTYRLQVMTHDGDQNKTGGDAGEYCQTVTLPASPAISTSATGATVGASGAAGTITDTATLTGATTSPAATGTITFSVYTPSGGNDCATLVKAFAPLSIVGPDSNGNYSAGPVSFTPSAAGNYFWIASYASGDTNNSSTTSKCDDAGETSLVNPVTPKITTAATASVTIGQPISDTAALAGTTVDPNGNPAGGTITFTAYFNDNTCNAAALVFTSSPVAVTGDGTYDSATFTPSALGTYYWIAVYSGNLPNTKGASTSCGDSGEASIVTRLPSTNATNQFYYPNDTATVTGTGTFNGTVSFELHKAPNCSDAFVYRELNDSLNGNTSGSTSSTNNTSYRADASNSGPFFWKVTYSGDSTHFDVTACVESSSVSISDDGSTTSP